MTKITIEVLATEMKNLTREVREGFKGVYDRQDKANGKLCTHDKLIIDLQKKDIKIENKFKLWRGYWLITGLLVSGILTLLGKYVF